MTQRIFDVENEKDMADLWDILPDRVTYLKDVKNERYEDFVKEVVIGNDGTIVPQELIVINWHDKTEITRPIQEATKADIGKLCCFWDSEYNPNAKIVGCLHSILPYKDVKYVVRGGLSYRHCHRLTKTEVYELC